MHRRGRLHRDEEMIGTGLGKVGEIALRLRRNASTTTGPIVIFGTKRPSMTSTWIQSAPAASTARISSARYPKSVDKIDGATIIGRVPA
jgi:hypothetical protein